MGNKLIKKVFCIFSLITILLTTLLSSFSQVFAVNIGDKVEIVDRGETAKHVKYKFDSGVYAYVKTHYVGYYENGIFRPAYCLNRDKPGVDDTLSYDVTIQEAMQNQAVYRVLLKGYPYAGNLGFSDEKDAFFVTKQAIYRVLDGGDTGRYQGADETGNRMVEKIKELVDYGRNGTETRRDPILNITTVKNASIDDKDSNYISQIFRVDSPINSKDIRIYMNGSQAPSGSKLTDMNNNEKSEFAKGEQFKVIVPRKNIKKDVSIDITATGNVETFPVFYTKAPNSAWQDYAIVSDPFVLTTTNAKMTYTEPTGTVEIEKVSKEDNEYSGLPAGSGLKGALFKLERIDGIETYKVQCTTDDFGKIIKELKLGTYRLTELVSADYYQIGKEGAEYEFTLEYDGQKIVIKVENDNVVLETQVEKDGDKLGQGNEVINYQISNVHNSSSVRLNNFKIEDSLPQEVRLQSITTGTFNEDLKYKVTYTTNKNNTKTIANGLSTTKDNTIDFTKEKLADDEYITKFALCFESVKSNFKSTKDITVQAKVIEGLEVNSTFRNCVVASGTYIGVTVEDKDCTPTTVYENKVQVNKTAAEDNQYTGDKAGDKLSNVTLDVYNADTDQKLGTINIQDGFGELKYLPIGKWYAVETSKNDYYVFPENNRFDFEITEKGQTVVLDIENDVVNLKIDVEKTGTVECKPGEDIEYNFDIQNKSNDAVTNFVWGDILPSEVRIKKLYTGTFNQENSYKVQYITNNNSNWKTVGTYNTTANNEIILDSETLGLSDGEYAQEIRFVFENKVEKGFKNNGTKVVTKANEDLKNNQIIENHTYLTADYLQTKLADKDVFHTIVRIPQKITLTGVLPRTGK